MKKDDRKPIRHGELVLLPIKSHDMSGAKHVTNYIASHSETGHHHVIEGEVDVLEVPGAETFIAASSPTNLVHKKSTDKHDTLPIPAGIYRVGKKKEYDPFVKLMRNVWD